MCLVVLGEGSQTSHSLMCIQALMLWGAVQAKTFEQEFIEAAMQSDALNDDLSLTEYPMFVKRMWREVQAKRERDARLCMAEKCECRGGMR